MTGPGLNGLLDAVSEGELRGWVERISGLRHGKENPEALEERARAIEARFAELDLSPRREWFRHGGGRYSNIVATLKGRESGLPPYLVGAHFDAAAGSPGADDNASAVAAMMAAAGALAKSPPRRGVCFVAFNLEEPQSALDWRYRHGSRNFARRSLLKWERYEGAFILESVGYTDSAPGSQRFPIPLPVPVPDRGTFLGVAGNRRARKMIRAFEVAAEAHAPSLEVIAHRFPCAGRFAPASRMSDNAPFWDVGYPAVMLTDTAFLRNPNYHTPGDLPETLDYGFLALVARALTAALAEG